jgi:hypothetical protein
MSAVVFAGDLLGSIGGAAFIMATQDDAKHIQNVIAQSAVKQWHWIVVLN